MKNFKNLWILKIYLFVFLLLCGPLASMALASDSKLIAEWYKKLTPECYKKLTEECYKNLTKEEKLIALALLRDLAKRKRSDRSCKLGNLVIVAGPDSKNLTSRQPAVKQSRRVPCYENSSKLCSEWSYRFFWNGPAGDLASVSLSLPSNLKLIKVIPGYGATVCSAKTADNLNPPSSREILRPKDLGKFSFETRWINCGVKPEANRIEVSFITPLAKPGRASAGGFSSSGVHKFCGIAGAGIRNVKPLGSSSNIQCLPPKKGDIVGVRIRKDPDNNLDIETGLRFFIRKGTKIPFQSCDGKTAIEPLVVESGFTTCGSSKGGSLCLIKNPKNPKNPKKTDAPQTFSISEGQHGEAGLICVDLKNAKPEGCDITGNNPHKPCSTFYCNTGGCNGTTYACKP